MFRCLLQLILSLTLLVIVLTTVAILGLFHRAIYDRVWNFPREAEAWEEIRAMREEPRLQYAWQHYRGVLHSHSHLSHDSDVPFEEILDVLKETDRDFIGMSDHCDGGKGDYSLQWRGVYDGKLFFPGYELNNGFMPWGLPSEVVLDCTMDEDELAAFIDDNGGLLFFAHTERERRWDLPQLRGKEIYNIHTDFILENPLILGLSKAPSLFVNGSRYPDQSLRLIFKHPTDQIARWDEMNRERRITGISANDSHQNIGIRARVTEDDTLLIEDTSPKTIAEYPLTGWRWLLARVLFGRLDPGKEVYHFQGDPYIVSVNMVSTHVLAAELSEAAILDALEQARAFVAFDAIADARGFVFQAEDGDAIAILGEYMPFSSSTNLRGLSPYPVQFEVFRHGEPVYSYEGREFAWSPPRPGAYRVEARLNIRGRWVPWVYTNPIYLTEPAGPNATETGHLLVSASVGP